MAKDIIFSISKDEFHYENEYSSKFIKTVFPESHLQIQEGIISDHNPLMPI